MSSLQQAQIGVVFPNLIDSAEELRDNLRETYSGYTINSEVSDKGIYFLGSYANTRTVTINTGEIDASSFRIWCVGAGGQTISVWTAGYGGGGTYADHTNTGGNMVLKMGGAQGNWSGYTDGYNDGDAEVAYDGYTMVAEGSGGGGTVGNYQGSYSNNFPGTKAGGSGGTGAASAGGGHSQYGGGGGAGSVASQGFAGNGYNYGGGGGSDSGRGSNSVNGGGGSSYGYGCLGCCNGAAYYGCSPTRAQGGGGSGADIVNQGTGGDALIVIQWGSGIKSVLSSYSSGAQNF